MKITQSIAPILFGKKLVATCTIQRNNKPAECNIFELNKKEDSDYFTKQEYKKDWEENTYLHEAVYALEEDLPNEKIFVLENKKKQCLGFALIEIRKDSEAMDLSLLETCKPYSYRNKDRKIKYVGENLITFLAKFAQKENYKKFCIPISSIFAKNFYFNCGFEFGNAAEGLILEESNYGTLIEQNKAHTQGEVKLIS